ncbi:YtzC family protein [Bacillus shivajii]|uniref:DUF2524 family protein n=1 Tax=Bacillus shivajii TaxID=1983719 RepID=UPI001CF99F3B|nr:DUF2524 family protein [Bacillus shivajii]UCZ54828.1 YtzC family protein [Bacillus shivajii]
MTNSSYLQGAINEIEHVMTNAEEQLTASKKVQPGDPNEFSEAQLQLEAANMELEKILRSATAEQRDQLLRLQQQVHQLQNRMILGL